MEYQIKRCSKEYASDLAELERQCFSVPWTYNQLAEELEGDNKHYFAALKKNGAVIGYGGFAQILDEGHIMNIAVAPDSRGQGVGSAIVDALIAKAKDLGIASMTLECAEGNVSAISLYEKKGFIFAGKRPDYYPSGEAARIYWLRFDG